MRQALEQIETLMRRYGHTYEANTAAQDSQALRKALIHVCTAMLAHGERNDNAEIMVSQFRKWLQSHV